jgi:hypothetical protein
MDEIFSPVIFIYGLALILGVGKACTLLIWRALPKPKPGVRQEVQEAWHRQTRRMSPEKTPEHPPTDPAADIPGRSVPATSCGARPQPPVISWMAAYLRLSLSNTLGWLVAVPDVPEEPLEPAAVLCDRPRMKYQIRAARIAKPRMIQSQEAPLPSSAGAGVAGGVAWARASPTPASVMIVKAWSLLSIMFPSARKGCGPTSAGCPRSSHGESASNRTLGHLTCRAAVPFAALR